MKKPAAKPFTCLQPKGVSADLVVADTTGIIAGYLRSVGINSFKTYTPGRPEGHVMVVGAFEPQQTGNPAVTDVLEWINHGNTLVILGHYVSWAPYLAKKEVIDFKGLQEMGRSWYRGKLFCKRKSFIHQFATKLCVQLGIPKPGDIQ